MLVHFFGFFPDYYENTSIRIYHVKKVLNIKDRVKILSDMDCYEIIKAQDQCSSALCYERTKYLSGINCDENTKAYHNNNNNKQTTTTNNTHISEAIF